MFNYKLVEQLLNEKVKKILELIRDDYHDNMSNEKKKVLESLMQSDRIVVVDQGISIFKDKTLAHGGRTLKDGKIHFYPDVRKFGSEEEIVQICERLLPHECFHYFIQPDDLEFDSEEERKIANYYTEGLVEREARKFYKRHRNVISFEEANYGFNISFANIVQMKLGLSNAQAIFSEDAYSRNIKRVTSDYESVRKRKEYFLDVISQIANEFPRELQTRAFERMRTMLLQSGNVNAIKERLKSFEFISADSIARLENSEVIEL